MLECRQKSYLNGNVRRRWSTPKGLSTAGQCHLQIFTRQDSPADMAAREQTYADRGYSCRIRPIHEHGSRLCQRSEFEGQDTKTCRPNHVEG